MDSTLNVTPEGSLSNLPAAIGDIENSAREPEVHQTPENEVTRCGSFYLCYNFHNTSHQHLHENSAWRKFK